MDETTSLAPPDHARQGRTPTPSDDVADGTVPPRVPPAPAVVLVTEPVAIAPALADLAAPVVGVDVERADADRYHRHAALVQVGVEGHCALLDGMALADMSELDLFLAERTTVLHASQNDLVPLASKGVRPRALADTAVAAAVLGLPTGLGALIVRLLGIDLGIDKSAFQRADWEARPLPDDMRSYAAGDVVHLPELWQALAGELDRTGRRSWYEQDLEATIATALAETRDWTRVKGIGRLTPEQRAIARRLWEAREEVAREHDIAPNVLLREETLVAVALDPPTTESKLVQRAMRNRTVLRRHAARLVAAIEEGRAAEPEPVRRAGRRMTDADRAVGDALRRRRAEVAVELGIDPGVLCPSRPLESAVLADPEGPEELCRIAELRPWQAELLAAPLWEAYEAARGAGQAGTQD